MHVRVKGALYSYSRLVMSLSDPDYTYFLDGIYIKCILAKTAIWTAMESNTIQRFKKLLHELKDAEID